MQTIARQFQIDGDFLEAVRHGSGHIHDTYLARYRRGGTVARYIHQRINHRIFTDPEAMMDNITRVTAHLRTRVRRTRPDDIDRRVLQIIPAREGGPMVRDDDGDYWRTYAFIGGSATYDLVTSPEMAYQAARAFGRFQADLQDLPLPRLTEILPGFHDTAARFDALQQAIANDPCSRAAAARPEIAFAERRAADTRVLADPFRAGAIPERITHNDTKINNVMMDDATGEGLCVIDLDTVMPGIGLYDFGDLVRTATSPAPEDERDLTRVTLRIEYYRALARGYLESMGPLLTPTERSLLGLAGHITTLECGIRFLTDFLQGDTYFAVRRPAHNLDRCRTQFKLVESIEAQQDEMNA